MDWASSCKWTAPSEKFMCLILEVKMGGVANWLIEVECFASWAIGGKGGGTQEYNKEMDPSCYK